MSAKNAGFLQFAIESLESSTDLLRGLPLKPKIEDLDFGAQGGQLPIPYLIPQTQAIDVDAESDDRGGGQDDGEGEEEEEDEEMMDASGNPAIMMEPIHSSAFQGAQFGAGWESAQYANTSMPTFGGGRGSYSGWDGQRMSTVNEDAVEPGYLFANGVNSNASFNDLASSRQPPVVMNGPFAGTPFQGLGARDWFDVSHHGSPEVEGMYGVEG